LQSRWKSLCLWVLEQGGNGVNNVIAEKFYKLAIGMTKSIADKRRPMSQNPTPKRMREYRSRLHDADNEERTQKALYKRSSNH
jgi:hypothetical protein